MIVEDIKIGVDVFKDKLLNFSGNNNILDIYGDLILVGDGGDLLF